MTQLQFILLNLSEFVLMGKFSNLYIIKFKWIYVDGQIFQPRIKVFLIPTWIK